MGALLLALASLTLFLFLLNVLLLGFLRKRALQFSALESSSADNVKAWRDRYVKERETRKIYDRALGFPVQDDLLADEIWARALQGDETAEAILEESLRSYTSKLEPKSKIVDL